MCSHALTLSLPLLVCEANRCCSNGQAWVVKEKDASILVEVFSFMPCARCPRLPSICMFGWRSILENIFLNEEWMCRFRWCGMTRPEEARIGTRACEAVWVSFLLIIAERFFFFPFVLVRWLVGWLVWEDTRGRLDLSIYLSVGNKIASCAFHLYPRLCTTDSGATNGTNGVDELCFHLPSRLLG